MCLLISTSQLQWCVAQFPRQGVGSNTTPGIRYYHEVVLLVGAPVVQLIIGFYNPTKIAWKTVYLTPTPKLGVVQNDPLTSKVKHRQGKYLSCAEYRVLQKCKSCILTECNHKNIRKVTTPREGMRVENYPRGTF